MGKGRNVYFRDESLWDDLEALAEEQDRSVNWILEDMVKKTVTNDEPEFIARPVIKEGLSGVPIHDVEMVPNPNYKSKEKNAIDHVNESVIQGAKDITTEPNLPVNEVEIEYKDFRSKDQDKTKYETGFSGEIFVVSGEPINEKQMPYFKSKLNKKKK